ncbi:uncharacterized protein ACR2FA_003380 [Aphomia sociella]
MTKDIASDLLVDIQDASKIMDTAINITTRSNSPSTIANVLGYNQNPHELDEQSDEDETNLVKRGRRRVQRFTDSESDVDKIEPENKDIAIPNDTNSQSHDNSNMEVDSDDEAVMSNISLHKSRIRSFSSSEDDVDTQFTDATKNKQQQLRMKNKRNKLKEKFQKFTASRMNEGDLEKITNSHSGDESSDHNSNQNSESSCDEVSSITEIKQNIKKKVNTFKTTICDPDTSDEETNESKLAHRKKDRKSTIPTSPKPMRLTAKQALENMHKIKSESNRMLREKEVSLPYHRPKALTLKDIMNRRKPAVTSDGKAFPLKMNDQQLKQYAQLLEQRQKEMMELCKSDTEEEEEKENETKIESLILETNSDKMMENVASNNDAEYDKCVSLSQDNSNSDKEIETQEMSENNTNEKAEDTSNSEMKLVYNDSLEDANNMSNDDLEKFNNYKMGDNKEDSEQAADSQSLHDDSDIHENVVINTHVVEEVLDIPTTTSEYSKDNKNNDDFLMEHESLDNDLNMEEIDRIIENAEIIQEENRDPLILENGPVSKNIMPKLTGAPGMVIDLDNTNILEPKKLSGVELLKERFTYFAKLKTPDQLEREKEKRLKPGTQHIKLKQELEEKIAEQRSLEWAKRLENEKQQKLEMNAVRGDISDEEDIEKCEAKLEEDEDMKNESSETEEEEDEEDDVELKDKPRKRNPMIDDEAEESDVDDYDEAEKDIDQVDMDNNANAEMKGDNNVDLEENNDFEECSDEDIEDDNDDGSDSSDDESSESEMDIDSKPKKGRILKAFEDSDDEETSVKSDKEFKIPNSNITNEAVNDTNSDSDSNNLTKPSEVISESQDEVLQLAQMHKSFSEDLFASQESGIAAPSNVNQAKDSDKLDLGTQTFSILNTDGNQQATTPSDLNDADKLTVICKTQADDDANLDAIVGMCSGSFSQNLVDSQFQTTQSQSQTIGEDILNLCTGKFYENEFVSQTNDNLKSNNKSPKSTQENPSVTPIELNNSKKTEDGNLLKSILDELNDPEFDVPKTNKYFPSSTQNKENLQNVSNIQYKKKFIIDSDDEHNEPSEVADMKQKKKIKKKKLEKRALQISDDEEDEFSEEVDDVMSEIEEDDNVLVEYDSEENEIEIKPQNSKKKRKMADFFEQEAELTSEDEWVGSGDEDEAGLDRMEREEGDDETFNQKKLQRELGQIHLRDVLDQDKREVRIIQELLFEDGDLGGEGRQRKFRWRNTDGDEEGGAAPDDFADTQEEEFESEEQWRKQRHEREVFLRQMEQKDGETENDLSININRTTIIKANLCSRTVSSLLSEVNKTTEEKTNSPLVPEKKSTNKDIPSPKKTFNLFQQSYHGSLLSRGSGSLARLAALATPLAVDDDAPKIGSLLPSNKRNFVFSALTQEENEPKVTKRKAETNIGTPRLVKKMKSEEKKVPKSSLLDHLKT